MNSRKPVHPTHRDILRKVKILTQTGFRPNVNPVWGGRMILNEKLAELSSLVIAVKPAFCCLQSLA